MEKVKKRETSNLLTKKEKKNLRTIPRKFFTLM